jgi:hypothetical protein
MRHTIALFGAALLTAGALAWGTSAHAQEERYFHRGVSAPSDAFELGVGTGYTQGFGLIQPARDIPSVAGAGIGVDVNLAYRVNPVWSLGVQGEYQEFASELNTAARGLAGNVGVTMHAAPVHRGDPWLRIATGYRGLWSVNPPGVPTTYIQGWQVAKASVGYDVRVSRAVAIAPEVGADVNLFVNQVQSGVSTSQPAQLGAFVFAGLQGRFDMGGTSTDNTVVAKNVR